MSSEERDLTQNYGDFKPYLLRNFKSIIKRLQKIWWIFVITGILAGLAGILYAGMQKINYKSSLTFALDDGGAGGSGIGNFLNLASQFGINMGGSTDIFAGDNILEIMKSRRMVTKVFLSIDTFNNKPYTLIEYYLDITGNFKSIPEKTRIHFPVGQLPVDLSYQQDSLLYKIYQNFSDNNILAQRPNIKLSIYEVNITSPDEKFTKDFTDRLVSATNEFYIEIRTKKAKQTLGILEQRVAAMRGSLNSSITNKAAIQDINVNPAFSQAQVPIQKQQANIQVYGEAYAEMFKNLELARFQYLNEIPLMQIIDTTDYPMQKIKIGKLKTGIIWALISALIIVFILWVIRIVNYNKNTQIQEAASK